MLPISLGAGTVGVGGMKVGVGGSMTKYVAVAILMVDAAVGAAAWGNVKLMNGKRR